MAVILSSVTRISSRLDVVEESFKVLDLELVWIIAINCDCRVQLLRLSVLHIAIDALSSHVLLVIVCWCDIHPVS